MAKRKNPRATSARKNRAGERSSARKKAVPCPIVGIGGSAGGFEAAMELLDHLPPKSGMAFVIV
ncbi:MAG TPA: chemotaxis protein CheB, partial [Chthoniobacterales bacterium]|nr:chemotaxis protein CheB [Chthoniobacterales bacterium]